MKTTQTESVSYRNVNKRLAVWAVVVAFVLLIIYLLRAPWTITDYFFGGAVLFCLAASYEFATVNSRSIKRRMVVAGIVIIILVAILGWAASGP